MNQNDLLLLVLLVVMVGMMFFSGRRRKKQALEMQESLSVGSKVVLHSGIIGSVKKINGDSVVVESAGSTIEVMRQAIRSINPVLAGAGLEKTEGKPAAKAPAAATSVAKKPAAKKPAVKKPAAK